MSLSTVRKTPNFHSLPDVWWETHQAQLSSNNFSSFKPQKCLCFVKCLSGSVFFHLLHQEDRASYLHQELLVKPQFLISSYMARKNQMSLSSVVASCLYGLRCFHGLQNLCLQMGNGALRVYMIHPRSWSQFWAK